MCLGLVCAAGAQVFLVGSNRVKAIAPLHPTAHEEPIAGGAPFIERVDLRVKLISHQLGSPSAEIDRTVETVDQKLNERIVEGGSGAE